MDQFVDMLKQRLLIAQQRLAEKQQKLQIAQAEHQMAIQEVGSLQTLIGLETTREQQKSAAAQQQRVAAGSAHSTPPANPSSFPAAHITSLSPAPVTPAAGATTAQPMSVSGNSPPETSKTDLVRNVLRRHTNGISPGGVWVLVKDEVERPYVYSVLKRMKDKGEVAERGGKYYLQVGKEEGSQVK